MEKDNVLVLKKLFYKDKSKCKYILEKLIEKYGLNGTSKGLSTENTKKDGRKDYRKNITPATIRKYAITLEINYKKRDEAVKVYSPLHIEIGNKEVIEDFEKLFNEYESKKSEKIKEPKTEEPDKKTVQQTPTIQPTNNQNVIQEKKSPQLTTVKHSYACSVLRENGFAIYKDGQRILKQLYPFEHKFKETTVKLGINYAKKYVQEEIKSISYNYLKKLGYKISVRGAIGENFQYQRVEYFIIPIDSNCLDYKKIPEGHQIDFDVKNQQIRLVGKNTSLLGISDWIPLKIYRKKKEEELNPFDLDEIKKRAEEIFLNNLPINLRPKGTQREKEINEIVIGITETNEFCCISKTKDAPVIAISGARGYGKSFLEHNLEGGFYYKYDYDIFNFNDIKGDTQTRCFPWGEDHPFYKDLVRFGEDTIPLPYIYLIPLIKGLTDDQILYKDEVGFEVSLSFKQLILDPNLIRYNKQWNLSDKSRKYIHNLMYDDFGRERESGLLHLKNLDNVSDILDNFLPQKMDNLRNAISNVIKSIWNKNILDISSNVNSKWVLKKGDKQFIYPAWDICLMSRLVPSFITSHIRNEAWFGVWIKYILEDVFKFVRESGYDRYLMLCGDELVSLLRDREIKSIIDLVIREGRTDKVGVTQVVQFRKDIPDSIMTNVTHNFIFKTNAKADLDLIRREFPDLEDEQLDDITNLKQFQCYAFGEFTLYNSEGDKYSNNGEPVKIVRIKPPNALHWGGK